MINNVFVFILFACWGSFLNVIAYSFLNDTAWAFRRSRCPQCRHVLHWYDNIPLVSFLILKGSCRFCQKPISYLYPAMELMTGCIFYAMFLLSKTFPPKYLIAYFILFSALLITIATDIQMMVIYHAVTLWLIPVAFLLAWFGLLPVSLTQSILGAVFGYSFLYLVALAYRSVKKHEGLGMGDMELLATIGAFLGPQGAWFSLLFGSCVGTIVGIFYILIKKADRSTPIPFGPFLAFGAIFYGLLGQYLQLINL